MQDYCPLGEQPPGVEMGKHMRRSSNPFITTHFLSGQAKKSRTSLFATKMVFPPKVSSPCTSMYSKSETLTTGVAFGSSPHVAVALASDIEHLGPRVKERVQRAWRQHGLPQSNPWLGGETVASASPRTGTKATNGFMALIDLKQIQPNNDISPVARAPPATDWPLWNRITFRLNVDPRLINPSC